MKLKDINLQDVGVGIRLVGAVYTDGADGLILVPLPTRDLSGPQQVLEMDLDEWSQFLRQADLVEVEALVEQPDGKIERAMVRKTQRVISTHTSWKVYRRDHYRCRYCGTNEVPLTVDHLILWEEGGPSIPENLLTACKECNTKRGDQPYHAWLNSGYYNKVSRNLPAAIAEANDALKHTLAAIPRTPIKPGKKRKR